MAQPQNPGGIAPHLPPTQPGHRIYAADVPLAQRNAYQAAYPNGLPGFYTMSQTSTGPDGIPKEYVEDNLPAMFYLNAPRNSRALFSRGEGQGPFRPVHHSLPRRIIHLWNRNEIQSVCNSLRRIYWHGFMHMEVPQSWDDLWEYFDAHDAFRYGATNVWNIICHLFDENRFLLKDPRVQADFEIGCWLDNWLLQHHHRDKLMAYDKKDGPIISVLEGTDIDALGDLSDQDVRVMESALHFRHEMLTAKTPVPGPRANDLWTAIATGNTHNWLAGAPLYGPNGLPHPPHSQVMTPHQISALNRPFPYVMYQGHYYYQPPPPVYPAVIGPEAVAVQVPQGFANAVNVAQAEDQQEPQPEPAPQSDNDKQRDEKPQAAQPAVRESPIIIANGTMPARLLAASMPGTATSRSSTPGSAHSLPASRSTGVGVSGSPQKRAASDAQGQPPLTRRRTDAGEVARGRTADEEASPKAPENSTLEDSINIQGYSDEAMPDAGPVDQSDEVNPQRLEDDQMMQDASVNATPGTQQSQEQVDDEASRQKVVHAAQSQDSARHAQSEGSGGSESMDIESSSSSTSQGPNVSAKPPHAQQSNGRQHRPMPSRPHAGSNASTTAATVEWRRSDDARLDQRRHNHDLPTGPSSGVHRSNQGPHGGNGRAANFTDMAGAHPNGPPPPYEALPPRVLNMPAPYERRYPSANNNLNWNSWNNNRRPGRPNTTCRNRNPRNRELYIPCDCSFCVERNRSIHVRVVTDSSNTHADQSSRIARALEDRFGPVETVVSGKVPLVFIVRFINESSVSQALHYGSGQLMDQYLIIRISATHRSKWCRPLDDWGTRRPAVATNGYGPRPPMATIGVRSALVHSCSTVCPEDGHKMEDPSLYSFTHIPKNGPFLQYDRGRPQRFVPNYVPMEIVAAAAQVQAQHQMAQPAPLAVPLVYPAVLAQQNHTRPPQQANSRAQNAEQPAEAGSQSKPPAEEVLARVGSEDELENGQTRQPPSSPTARVSFPPSPAGQEPSTTRNRMDDLKSKVIDNSKANDKAEVKDKGKEKANDEARNESGEKTKDEAANEEDDEEPIEHDFEDYHMSGREVPFKPIRILSSDQIRRARRAEPPKYGPMTQEETLLEVAAAYRRQRGGSSLASSSRRQGQSSQQTLRLSTGHSVNTATSNAAVAKGLPRAAFTEDKIRKRKLASDRIPMPLSSRITSRSASNVDCLYPPSPASKKASQTPQPKSKEKTAGVTVASAKSGPSSASSASSSEQVSDTKASPLRKEVRYKRPDDTKPCLEAGPGEDVGNLAITKTQTRPKGVGKSAAPPADKPKGTTEASHQDDKSSEAPAKGATDKEA